MQLLELHILAQVDSVELDLKINLWSSYAELIRMAGEKDLHRFEGKKLRKIHICVYVCTCTHTVYVPDCNFNSY